MRINHYEKDNTIRFFKTYMVYKLVLFILTSTIKPFWSWMFTVFRIIYHAFFSYRIFQRKIKPWLCGASKRDLYGWFFFLDDCVKYSIKEGRPFATLSICRRTKPKSHVLYGRRTLTCNKIIWMPLWTNYLPKATLLYYFACRTAITKLIEAGYAYLVGARLQSGDYG